jgi:hypothetical protein
VVEGTTKSEEVRLEETPSEVVEQLKTTPKPKIALQEVLALLRDNFVLVSAAAVLVGIAFATTVLAAYLSVFDWHLIWFVQYPDILTFGLIAVGIIPGSALFLLPIAQGILLERKTNGSFNRSGLIFSGLVVAAMIAFTTWSAVRKGDGYSHILSALGAVANALFLFVLIAAQVRRRQLPDSVRTVIMCSLFFSCGISLGQWLGESIEETSAFNQDVYLKDQSLNNVKLVIVMSKHTVLLKDKVLYVVPTEDISKFRSTDKNTRPKFAPDE